MGYVPEWARGSQAKTSNKVEHGIKKMELFHNATKPGSNANQTPFTRHYADGGDVNIRGEKVGEYSGDDEIVKYRMGMTDENGRSLLKKDNEIGGGGYGDGYEPESGNLSSMNQPTSTALVSEPAGSEPDTGGTNKSTLVSEPTAVRKSAGKSKPVSSKLVEEPEGSEPDPGPSYTTIPDAKLAPRAKDQLADLRRSLRGESQRTRAARKSA